MKSVLLTLGLLLFSSIWSCSQNASTQKNSTGGVPNSQRSNAAEVSNSPADSQHAETEDQRALRTQIEQIAATAKGHVGVAALMLEDGDAVSNNSAPQLSVSFNAADHFPMQSVYKLPIGMAVMKQVDAGKLSLDQKVRVTKNDFIGRDAHSPIRDKYPNGVELSVRELMVSMLGESDGTASDVLMKLAGGPAAVQAYLTELNIKDMIVLDTEKSFAQDHSLQYRNWTSPEAAVSLLRTLYERRGLSESSQSLLLKLMIGSTTGPKRLKGLLPAGADVAHKTGTSGTDNGVTAATNDIGLLTLPNGRHVAIAVFVADSPADEATRQSVIAKIAKAVWDDVTRRRVAGAGGSQK